MPEATVVLSRSPEACPERRAFEDALSAAFAAEGRDVLLVPHIYHHAPTHAAALRLARIEGQVIVLAWLHPRVISDN